METSAQQLKIEDVRETRSDVAVAEKQNWKAFSMDFIAAALIGGVAHSAVAPIERAKLVLQTQYVNIQLIERKKRYRGMVDAIVRITREEGILGLWRGNGSSIMRYYPSVALNFAFKDYYRTLFSANSVQSHTHISLVNFSAGALAGASSLLLTYPLDIAHTGLATDVGIKKQFKGVMHFMVSVCKREGVRGLYHGFPASLHGIVVHRGLYFGCFDTFKQVLLEDQKSSSFWYRWILAQAATTSAGIVSYPLDTVRHRMMMQAGRSEILYRSTWDCWKKTFVAEGFTGFYRGLFSNMVRGTGSAFILVSYDEMKWFIHNKFGSRQL